MLACDWFKNCHDNAAKVKLQTSFFDKNAAKFYFYSVIQLEKPLLQRDSSLQATYLTDCRKCECYSFKTVYDSLKQFVFQFLFHDAHAMIGLSFVFQF